jgi:hypothetical protein
MGSTSPLLSLVGWYFLPSVATRIALSGFYFVFPHQRPIPLPSPTAAQIAAARARAQKHARLAHLAVIAVYLIYTLLSSYLALVASPNFYVLLGLPVSQVDEAALKAQWRRFARIYHPDKIGQSAETEQRFVIMRKAFEVLQDEIKREAYDRYKPRQGNIDDKADATSQTTGLAPTWCSGVRGASLFATTCSAAFNTLLASTSPLSAR